MGEYECECVCGRGEIIPRQRRAGRERIVVCQYYGKKEVHNHIGCMIFMEMCIWTMYLEELNLLVCNFIYAIHQNILPFF